MNTQLLRRIQRQILKEPEQFQMRTWFTSWSYSTIPNCGTAACIGGWAVSLKHGRTPRDERMAIPKGGVFEAARRAVGLTTKQAHLLFIPINWPARFKRFHHDNPKQAVARISHFIKTKGED